MADDPFGLDLPTTSTGPDLTDPYIRARLGLPPIPASTSAGELATNASVSAQHPAARPANTSDAIVSGRVGAQLVGGPLTSDTAPVAGIQIAGAGKPVAPVAQTQGSSLAAGANDDQTKPKKLDIASSTTTVAGFGELISKDNILKNLSNITYSFSWYIMSKEQYIQFLKSPSKSIAGAQLLIQSGGIEAKGSRNEYFDLDFYMDQIKIQHLASPKGTGSAHTSLTIEFKVFEPNGITLLDRLSFASRAYCASADNTNAPYQAQHYLLVLRFYGQDEAGKQLTASQLGLEPGTDSLSVVEKFFPMTLTNIAFRISNNITEYSCRGILPGEVVGLSSATAVIPFNFELSAIDLQTALNGNLVESAAGQAPATAQSAPKKTISQGLTPALNKYEDRLVPTVNHVANQFEIRLHGEIKKARLTKPGEKVKGQMPMVYDHGLIPDKVVTETAGRKFSINAGTPIVQVIDLLVRSSTYITDQQNIIFDEKTGLPKVKDSTNNEFKWYMIRMSAEPVGELDPTRGSFAYKIIYDVTPYKTENLKSPYFPRGSYKGAYKTYNYWFTGQNTEVLSFEQNFDYLFFQPKAIVGVDPLYVSNAREWERRVAQVRSPESSQGGAQGSTEPSANMAHVLYSPGDQATAKLSILGDPDWIEQSEAFYNARTINLEDWLPDGSINFSARQPLFELRYNTPTDYNLKYDPNKGTTEELDQGTMPVTAFNSQRSVATGETNIPAQSQVYQALTITSLFDRGRFTQELYGTIMNFPVNEAATAIAQRKETSGAESSAPPVNAQTNATKAPVKSIWQEAAKQAAKPGAVPIENGGNLYDNGLFASPVLDDAKPNTNMFGISVPNLNSLRVPIVPYDPTRPPSNVRLDGPKTPYQQQLQDLKNQRNLNKK